MARDGDRTHKLALMRVGWALAAGMLAVASTAGTSAAAWQVSPPPMPTGLSAAPANNGEVTLTWDDPSDNRITGYEYDFQAEIAKLTASDAAADDSFGQAVAVDGDTMVVGASGDDSSRGAAYVYVREAGVWSEVAKLTASDRAVDDKFGVSVAIDGGTVVVGASKDDDRGTDSGSVYVFSEPAGGWVNSSSDVKLTAALGSSYAYFGNSVAVDGGTVVVGAYQEYDGNSRPGSAYVFNKPVGGWVSARGTAKLTPSSVGWNARFGSSVAIDGDVILVGSYWRTNGGAAHVFEKPAGGWGSASSDVMLTASDRAHGDSFGYSVAVDGGTVMVGATGDDDGGSNSGSVYAFSEPAGGWVSASSDVKLTASGSASNIYFGRSVAVDGGTVVVGAEGSSVYVFGEPAGGWVSATSDLNLTASNPASNDWFGRWVAFDGGTVVVGATGDDDGGSYSGSAYVFHASVWAAVPDSAPGEVNATSFTVTGLSSADYGFRVRAGNSVGVSDPSASATATASLTAPAQPTGLAATVAGSTYADLSWDASSDTSLSGYQFEVQAETAQLATANPAVNDALGVSVAIDGDVMVVGAPFDDVSGVDSGAASVFVRELGLWSRVAELSAGDGVGGDEFGESVAVDGDVIVVGARNDDDGGVDSGSAYVFVKPVSGWATATSNLKLTALDAAAYDGFGGSVAIEGDTVVVGASGDDDNGSNSGSVYVFTEPAAGWASATSNVKLTASDGAADDGFGGSVAIEGDTVVVGASGDDDNGSNSGSVYVFTEPAAGGWVSAAGNVKLTASDGAAGDGFGASVAIDGGTVAVGAASDDDDDNGTDSGSVYLFSEPSGAWRTVNDHLKLTAADAAADDGFGASVAIDGDTVVVSATGDDDNGAESGSVYVYKKPAEGWNTATSDTKLTASDGAAGDSFGASVAIDGDTVAVGAPGNDDTATGSGSAYVYRATGWTDIADSAPGETNNTTFTVTGLANGTTHSIRIRASNSVGASVPSAAATVTLVRNLPTGLSAEASDGELLLSWHDPADSTVTGFDYELRGVIEKLVAPVGVADDRLGFTVAVDGDTIAVGAPGDAALGVQAGAVHVLVKEFGVWAHAAVLRAADGAAGDGFGRSVAVDDDTVVVGAPYDDDGGSDSGSVYVFSKPSSGWATVKGSVKLTASDPASQELFGRSVAVDGTDVVVGASNDNSKGSVYVFSEPAGGWASATSNVKLTAFDAANGDDFGRSVAIDGDTVVVGAEDDDDGGSKSGSAYVFSKPAGGWATANNGAKLTAADAAEGDRFGRSVAIDGSTVVVGAPNDDDGGADSGSAYVFSEPAGGWATASDDVKLTAADAAADSRFGHSVAIDDTTVMVGAHGDDDAGSGSGSVYVFAEPAGGWATTSSSFKLVAADGATNDWHGLSVAIDGTTVVVGAPYDDDNGSGSGSVYMYHAAGWTAVADSAPGGANATSYTVSGLTNGITYDVRIRLHNSAGISVPSAIATATLVTPQQPTGLAVTAGDAQATLSWDVPADGTITGYEYELRTELAMLAAGDANIHDSFGRSVAIDGDTMVVGAPYDDSLQGSAYVFVRQSGAWNQAGKLTAADGAAFDHFGWSVAVDDETIVVGAFRDNQGGWAAGSAYVFSEPASGWANAAGSIKLTAADAAEGDHFGRSVAIDDDTIVVGAIGDGDGGPASGSAYVFSEPASGWASATSSIKLTAADAAAADYFGWSVAIHDDTVVAGAVRDDDKGAVYVFIEPASGWASAAGSIKLTAAAGAADDYFGQAVAIDHGTVVVGAFGTDDGGSASGSAYVFSEPDTGWATIGGDIRLTAADRAAGDHLGWSVAIDYDMIVVGAYRHDDGGTDTGSAYMFAKPAAGWATNTETAKLTASDAAADDQYGYSVAIDDDTVVVGAPENDSQALDAGAGYIYQTTDWTAIADSAPGKANATSYTIANLVNGVRYSARIRAVNLVGASNPSHAIAFTPTS